MILLFQKPRLNNSTEPLKETDSCWRSYKDMNKTEESEYTKRSSVGFESRRAVRQWSSVCTDLNNASNVSRNRSTLSADFRLSLSYTSWHQKETYSRIASIKNVYLEPRIISSRAIRRPTSALHKKTMTMMLLSYHLSTHFPTQGIATRF